MTAEDVKRILGLQPHPREGGWFVRTYEADEMVDAFLREGTTLAMKSRARGVRKMLAKRYGERE